MLSYDFKISCVFFFLFICFKHAKSIIYLNLNLVSFSVLCLIFYIINIPTKTRNQKYNENYEGFPGFSSKIQLRRRLTLYLYVHMIRVNDITHFVSCIIRALLDLVASKGPLNEIRLAQSSTHVMGVFSVRKYSNKVGSRSMDRFWSLA